MAASTQDLLSVKSLRITKAMQADIINNVRNILLNKLNFSMSTESYDVSTVNVDGVVNLQYKIRDMPDMPAVLEHAMSVNVDNSGGATRQALELMVGAAYVDQLGDTLVAIKSLNNPKVNDMLSSVQAMNCTVRELSETVHGGSILKGNFCVAPAIPVNVIQELGLVPSTIHECHATTYYIRPSSSLVIWAESDLYKSYANICTEIRTIRRKFRKEMDEKVNNIMKDVVNVIESVNTTKQLLTAWPEVREFLPSYLVDPSGINLPALLVDTAAISAKIKSL